MTSLHSQSTGSETCPTAPKCRTLHAPNHPAGLVDSRWPHLFFANRTGQITC